MWTTWCFQKAVGKQRDLAFAQKPHRGLIQLMRCFGTGPGCGACLGDRGESPGRRIGPTQTFGPPRGFFKNVDSVFLHLCQFCQREQSFGKILKRIVQYCFPAQKRLMWPPCRRERRRLPGETLELHWNAPSNDLLPTCLANATY